MGIDINNAQALIMTVKSGIELGHCVTLGRQELFVRRPELLSLLLNRDINIDARDKAELLDPTERFADTFFRVLGAKELVSLDASDFEGATVIHDMNYPISSKHDSAFDCVFDGGTLEHIFNFPQAIKNCMQMLKPGGTFVGASPTSNFSGHGFYQFSADLYYRIFAAENGFEVLSMLGWEEAEGSPFYRIPDPSEVGERVCFTTSHPAYLYVAARRVSERIPLLKPPQQSDYVVRWKATSRQEIAFSARAWARRVIKRTPGAYRAFSLLRITPGGSLRRFTTVRQLKAKSLPS